ncbi:MAG TPA: APC family permease [Chloroflexia bacterium]|nr:APC family permease [Chloroflexia bacterium]
MPESEKSGPEQTVPGPLKTNHAAAKIPSENPAARPLNQKRLSHRVSSSSINNRSESSPAEPATGSPGPTRPPGEPSGGGPRAAKPADNPSLNTASKVEQPPEEVSSPDSEVLGSEPLNSPRVRRGTRPGDRYVRIRHSSSVEIRSAGPRKVQLLEEDLQGKGLFSQAKRLLIGRPIASSQFIHQRLDKVKALAIFASDALSSVAYATEATMFVLVTAVASAQPMAYVIPISIVICVLIALVVNSYRQTVYAYPGGGGSYIVSKDNLGVNAGLVAAAAILIDYTLTVAVSVAAGVAAITSAIPFLNGSQVIMGVSMIFLIMLVNLRGVRESGTIFAIPTYLFIASFLTMLGYGLFRVLTGDYSRINGDVVKPATADIAGFSTHPLSIFLLLQAFAAGCAALTGTEAISDGVQAFKKPESRNAATTLVVMGGLLITFFLGTSYLAYHLNALPDDPNSKDYETVISEIARYLFGGSSPLYYILQASTALILVLAANTAFADFPRLSFFLARDKFMPNIFSSRGDRLAYSTGIIVLAILAALLLAVFNGHTESLIPLYAVGVFLAFTLSQTGMVLHWQKEKRRGVRGVTRSQVFNATGAVATGIVLVILIVTKFLEGAWLVVLLIPIIFLMFKAINRHYQQVAEQLKVSEEESLTGIVKPLPVNGERKHTVIVPISRINKVTLSTLDFATSLSEDVTALFISDEPADIETMAKAWASHDIRIPLVVLENPYRSIVPALLNYISEVDSKDKEDILMIVLPEFVARHWWEHLLHNQTALRIKSALHFRPGVVVVDVRYHMNRNY